jgi:hypothetical protein
MADKKPKRETLVSPRGILKYPRLNEPDTKFKAEGEYSTKLVLTADEAAPLIEKLKTLHAAAVKEGKKAWSELKPPVQKKNPFKEVDFYSDDLDADGNETGNVVFNFKLPATGKDKATNKTWTNKPALFDGKGTKLPQSVSVWGGSEGRISFEVMPFFVAAVGAGISLRLKAVKIAKLVQGGERGAEGYGFGDDGDDDGYEYNAETDNAKASSGAADDDDLDNSDEDGNDSADGEEDF